MQKIKVFIEDFFKVESRTATLKRVPDLDSYNESVERLNSFFTDTLKGAWGYQIINELDDEDVYEMFEGTPDDIPRHLFKISRYEHEKYGDVWVCYTSVRNPDVNHKILNEAMIIVQEGDDLKIATKYGYSRENTSKKSYKWGIESGYRDLTFDSLGSPESIERYQEPVESFDGLKHYNADI
ncbi:hypothetical protein [Flavivirga jejuensis]|uniref:Uncharacterized protein n=1 Tax=Flavivirga jejuensis TaxID=870487 RepID=A0ABT8WPJ9_9FLAO|nr:hypothetical protein [Flavivirga jejuensis]MDO5974847.1 hypothetical protein [Flavivirga jejuensis]